MSVSLSASDSPDSPEVLRPGEYVDSGHPRVQEFARGATAGLATAREKAVRLFFAVRDGIKYDPYSLEMNADCFKASRAIERGASFCVPKAAVLAASARVVGIPSRLGFADVKNHLTTPKLRARMGTDEFRFHGYTELWLGGRWIKVTPTFNLALCEKFGVQPLDFDGEHDALFHPFDKQGRKHMEYVRYHGTFADVPLDLLVKSFFENYPGFAERMGMARPADLDFEKEAESLR